MGIPPLREDGLVRGVIVSPYAIVFNALAVPEDPERRVALTGSIVENLAVTVRLCRRNLLVHDLQSVPA